MIYMVKPGDTLFFIAQRFGTTVSAILAVNPQIVNPDIIFIGQTLFIPMVPPAPPTPVCPVLRRGDRGPAVSRLQTLLRVARFDPDPIDGIFGPRTEAALRAFQRSQRELEETGIADPETWTGLGAECYPSPGVYRYIVRPGESLFIIAARFGVSVEAILRFNPGIVNPNLIFAGQVIFVPVF